MKIAAEHDIYDVVVVGLGPVGATLANLLGMSGAKVLVLEREALAYHLPRAVHFDDEVMRVFQWIGIAEKLLPKIRINPGMKFVSGDGELLLDWPRPQEESQHAWHPSWRFHQPDLEASLRQALETYPNVTIMNRCEAFMIDGLQDEVSIRFENMSNGEIKHVRASYLVGCDGARSLVRRFIESPMKDFGFHERWLVVDAVLKTNKPSLGDHSIQYCDATRPATYIRGPGKRRRWEISVNPSENSVDIAKEESVWNLLAPWLTPDEAEIERSAVYTFHSLVAKTWSKERLFIAGDAAHQTPPFMGQGMCAGIRDVANLAWKLVACLRHGHNPTLLDTYQTERKPNAEAFIETAIRLGHLINTANGKPALEAAIKSDDGHREMTSLYPPLGQGLGDGVHCGKQFSQPKNHLGQRMDDLYPYECLFVVENAMENEVKQLTGIDVASTSEFPSLKYYLDGLDAKGVLLRPDRYILGTGNTVDEIVELISLLPYDIKNGEGIK
ncbi:bifunctional 3-(3-hydroxy-phenyl)propionate/3-hydroxycinnamic acid hydroxylase MhpA [Grimontia marina]|uniref:3-(3-hydroxy-phenyl)propionate/3-hydroxycinnamic acid hydroxylase n=1 Tax=Grimontia marina TaxID=646534 RepID=A0A128EZD9_9GAMM|nr:bifunctional 3-(3-hydroxy-phenyl)propionate/3-hydroxycinnamic acid hydroxylase [Grimontia marina]CZF79376.1 3-(3-hydroxy-phenyl)propionate/3-hydroxycinnamic acid hydroxylase [Grimontia marina]